MADRIIIEKALETISQNLNELRNSTDIDWQVYRNDLRARRFVERTLHVIIEACMDIAHHIISSDGMREPATYRERVASLRLAG